MTLTWGCRSLAQQEFLHVGAFKREYAQESPVRGRGQAAKGKKPKQELGQGSRLWSCQVFGSTAHNSTFALSETRVLTLHPHAQLGH